jgi:IS5 family transposase
MVRISLKLHKLGYAVKAHANVDEDGFIKATAFTAGNVHDSNHFTELLSGDESAVYADSAYSMMNGLKSMASTIE